MTKARSARAATEIGESLSGRLGRKLSRSWFRSVQRRIQREGLKTGGDKMTPFCDPRVEGKCVHITYMQGEARKGDGEK